MSRDEGQTGSGAARPVHWIISGRVQGVGFRYHVAEAARTHGVSGDVRNLSDGRVEMRAAGGELESFLAEVRKGPYGSRVDTIQARPIESQAKFDGFEIRY